MPETVEPYSGRPSCESPALRTKVAELLVIAALALGSIPHVLLLIELG